MTPADSFAAAAESLLDVRFRLHGRSRESGLDCIGLVACALGQAGLTALPPHGYALRNTRIARHLDAAASSGFAETTAPIARGDLLLVRPGPAQHHLLVATGAAAFVHAHAGLRRVVRLNTALPWPVLRHWRLDLTAQD